ncbi:hypothetical protein BC792_10182 [Sphingobacterium allocomposti]|jgi:hypothetical protein|uniref:Uncharacterized protein n=1 Tax=Sphingobacterium allocomposti TaxID=415956 RepID=A0A5S5DSS1_9SPHI|nr:hypothetical protein BC792_10182 [Sphingobacterium composti Yoo et al. 2007 non Ten et al. 2007]
MSIQCRAEHFGGLSTSTVEASGFRTIMDAIMHNGLAYMHVMFYPDRAV